MFDVVDALIALLSLGAGSFCIVRRRRLGGRPRRGTELRLPPVAYAVLGVVLVLVGLVRVVDLLVV